MAGDISGWIGAVWWIVTLYWLIAAMRTTRATRATRREASWSRAIHLSIIAVAAVLLFGGALRYGGLGDRFRPESRWIDRLGLVLTVVGCGFAIWARARLGNHWSGGVAGKEGHELIRTGPYAVVRHPIYAGFLLGILGTALAAGEWRGLLALGLAFLAWWRKARIEERLLVEMFGDAYESYRREVRAFIPFLF